jgi:hypothetical protein
MARCPAHDDGQASLSIVAGTKGASIVVKCFAGCTVEAIVAALGLTLADLFDGTAPMAHVVRTVYRIREGTGTVIAEHVREDLPNGGKRLWWRRNGKRGLGGLKVQDLPLYGAPELAAAPTTATVVVVEGEKACDALARRSILAVGTVTGASAIPADDVLRALVGHDVVLWPDHDPAGHTHMARIAARLQAIGA